MSVDRDLDSQRLLLLDLQWFADDDTGKTEEPTAKKLSEARQDGNIAKSRELGNAVCLLALFLTLRIYVSSIGTRMLHLFSEFYAKIPDFRLENCKEISGPSISVLIHTALFDIIKMCLPFFIIGLLACVGIDLYQVRFLFTTKPLQPKFSKMNPANGIKRLFSKDSLLELVKSIAKIILIAGITYASLKDNMNQILLLYDMALVSVIAWMGNMIIDVGIKISAAFLVLGILDYMYQKWKHHKDLKMTKQEVKDEYKNTEGDPEIKGKQRARMREAAQRRMMQDVPKADVVITNPTHLAVALKYDAEVSQAPVVLAKGADYLAMQIKEKAREAKIEIVENKPLARMLYANVEIGEEIPPELYQTVAEILAAVYRLNHKI